MLANTVEVGERLDSWTDERMLGVCGRTVGDPNVRLDSMKDDSNDSTTKSGDDKISLTEN